jgi:hypothetical protein
MPIAHTDLERLSQGRVGGVFWSAYVPWYVISYATHQLLSTDSLFLAQMPMPVTISQLMFITSV